MSLADSNAPYQVQQEVKSLMKVYPTGLVKLWVYEEPVYYPRFDYNPKRRRLTDKKRKREEESPEDREKRLQWRARTNFMDLALSNDFDLFPTFTFDKLKVGDRFDVDELKQHMKTWFGNQRWIHGKFRYLILPQYHKCEACVKTKANACFHADVPRAIHFHAMFGGYNGQVVDSGHKDEKGRTKYDVKSYQLGMAKAFKIAGSMEEREKIVYYISRYIARDMPIFKGQHRYWSSIGLKRPLNIPDPLLNDEDRERFTEVPTKSTKFKAYEFHGQFSDADLARIADYGRRREDNLTVLGL